MSISSALDILHNVSCSAAKSHSQLYILVHRDVPNIAPYEYDMFTRIETRRVNTTVLLAMTQAAHLTLPGCATDRPRKDSFER